MPLASTKPLQSRPTKSSNTSASPDNTNTSPSWRSPKSSTPLPVSPTHYKNISTITISRRTDVNTWPSSKRSLASPSSPQDQLPSPKPSQNRKRPHPLLPKHLLKVQPLTSLTSLAQSKISNNLWLRLLLSNMRSQPVNLSLRCMVNQQPILPSRQLSRQIRSVCRRTRNSWRRRLPNYNRNSQVLGSVVMALSPSNRCNLSRPAFPRTHSSPLCSNPSRVRHLSNSNNNNHSCNKTLSRCNSNSKMLLLCNNNRHKYSLLRNKSSRKQLIPSVNQ